MMLLTIINCVINSYPQSYQQIVDFSTWYLL